MQVDVCDLKQACFELDMWAEGHMTEETYVQERHMTEQACGQKRHMYRKTCD